VGYVNPILRPAFNFCFNGWGYRVGTARVLAFSVLAGRHIEVFRGIEMLKAARGAIKNFRCNTLSSAEAAKAAPPAKTQTSCLVA
jgi:hypothetical protein